MLRDERRVFFAEWLIGFVIILILKVITWVFLVVGLYFTVKLLVDTYGNPFK